MATTLDLLTTPLRGHVISLSLSCTPACTHVMLQEAHTSEDENSLALIEQDLIAVESSISHNKDCLAAVKAEIIQNNELVNSYEVSFKRNHIIIERKQNYMDDRNRLLATLLEKREAGIMIHITDYIYYHECIMIFSGVLFNN